MTSRTLGLAGGTFGSTARLSLEWVIPGFAAGALASDWTVEYVCWQFPLSGVSYTCICGAFADCEFPPLLTLVTLTDERRLQIEKRFNDNISRGKE